MDLQDEFQSLKKNWSSKSLPAKILAGTGYFFAVSAVASIADKVFTFRGFVVEGVGFYRSLLMTPLGGVANWFGLETNQYAIDGTVLCTVYAVASVRALKVVWGPSLATVVSIFLIPSLFLYFLIVSFLPSELAFLFLVISATTMIGSVWMFWRDDGAPREVARLTLIYMVAVFLLVAVVAGMSEGLTRSLS